VAVWGLAAVLETDTEWETLGYIVNSDGTVEVWRSDWSVFL